MKNLSNHNEAKLIILENGEQPTLMSLDEILDKYDNYAHSMAYKNRLYILKGYHPQYDEEDLYLAAMEGLFIAYNEYDVRYHTPFLSYAKLRMKYQLKNIKDEISYYKRGIDENTVYIDLESDDNEEFLGVYSDFDTTKLDICEYIYQIIKGDRFEKEMQAICDSALARGVVDFDEVEQRTGRSKMDISNIKKKLKRIIIKENNQSKYFKGLVEK